MTNISDGTGESLVEKITKANETFMTADGNRKIARINWSINTLNRNGAVELLWEGETSEGNATAVIISGQGTWDFRHQLMKSQITQQHRQEICYFLRKIFHKVTVTQ